MARLVYLGLLFCGIISLYGLPTTTSDDDTQGCTRLNSSCAKKRHKKVRKQSANSAKKRNIKHSAISIAKEKPYEEVVPADNHIVHVYMPSKGDIEGGDDAENVYATNFRTPSLYHPYTGGVKRSNIIIPFQNFVVNDDKTANKIIETTKEAISGAKRNPVLMQKLYDMEYARQFKFQRQRQLDIQRFQNMYMQQFHQLHQQNHPLYHLTPSAFYWEYPRALYNPQLQYMHQSHDTPRFDYMGHRQMERSALSPILNAYHTLLRTPIKDFVKALHMAKYDHET